MDLEISSITDQALKNKIELKLSKAQKPLGAFGVLSSLATQVALIQKSENPVLRRPSILIFAADHGIVEQQFPNSKTQSTYQKVLNFLSENTTLNVLVKSNRLNLQVVDMGVGRSLEDSLNYWLKQGNSFIDNKIALGTQNFLEKPAMSTAQCNQAIADGAAVVQAQKKLGTNVIGLGAVGMDNAASASVLSAALLDLDLEDVLEIGLTLDEDILKERALTLEKAYKKHPKTHDAKTLLTVFGGFEIAALVGAYLKAAQLRMVILVDGFISTTALLYAIRINSAVLEYCIFSHQESGVAHQYLLDTCNAKPLLQLGLKLDEGAGVAMAYPILKSAVQVLNSFE